MFITLEGMEGAGKTTLIQFLKAYFEKSGKNVLLTREPGGSALGKSLRSLILNQDSKICPRAELFLFLADRAEHVYSTLRPALTRGEVVLCDRYVDSTLAYQGYARGLDLAELENLNALATDNLMPHITFLLDLDPNKGLQRARQRNVLENTEQSEGRFEAEELNFHQKVREGFLDLAKKNPHRFFVLDATKTPEEVASMAVEFLEKF